MSRKYITQQNFYTTQIRYEPYQPFDNRNIILYDIETHGKSQVIYEDFLKQLQTENESQMAWINGVI